MVQLRTSACAAELHQIPKRKTPITVVASTGSDRAQFLNAPRCWCIDKANPSKSGADFSALRRWSPRRRPAAIATGSTRCRPLAQRKQSLWYRVAILPKRARDVKQERPREGSALIVDAKSLLVINDHNYPGGQGRGFGPDNNEFILIGLADRLPVPEPGTWILLLAGAARVLVTTLHLARALPR